MIIWIDGTYGVGKSTICRKLKEILIKNNYEILSSDYYFIEMHKKIFIVCKNFKNEKCLKMSKSVKVFQTSSYQ